MPTVQSSFASEPGWGELIGAVETPGVEGRPDELFRSVADAAPALIWMAEPAGGCTYFNRAWLEFRGRRLDEELGDGWAEGCLLYTSPSPRD